MKEKAGNTCAVLQSLLNQKQYLKAFEVVDEINIEDKDREKEDANRWITTRILEGKFDALLGNIYKDVEIIRAAWAAEYAINCSSSEAEEFLNSIHKNLSAGGSMWTEKGLEEMEDHYSSDENPQIKEMISEQKKKRIWFLKNEKNLFYGELDNHPFFVKPKNWKAFIKKDRFIPITFSARPH